MFRATVLLIGSALALSQAACGSEESSPPVDSGPGPSPTAAAGESPTASRAASVVPSCGPTATDESSGLTGVWGSDDNGIYYLRETGDGRLWWFGTDVGRSTGNTFSNVAVGRIDGDVIQLEWADVPYGTWLNRGDLTLQVSADGHTLTTIEATGGFGGTTWTQLTKCSGPRASESPEARVSDERHRNASELAARRSEAVPGDRRLAADPRPRRHRSARAGVSAKSRVRSVRA